MEPSGYRHAALNVSSEYALTGRLALSLRQLNERMGGMAESYWRANLASGRQPGLFRFPHVAQALEFGHLIKAKPSLHAIVESDSVGGLGEEQPPLKKHSSQLNRNGE